MKQGFVYIMSNSVFKSDIFKVGQTKLDPSIRANTLSRTTGVLGAFEVRYAVICIDCLLAEQTVHKRLSDYRIDKGKEFFQADFELIKSVVDDSVKQIDNDFFKKVSDNVEVISQALSDISNMVKDIKDTLNSYCRYKNSYLLDSHSENLDFNHQDFLNNFNNLITIKAIKYIPNMKESAVYDEPIRFFESKAQKTAYELSKNGLTPYQIAKKIFPFVNGQKTAKVKQWLSEM